METAQATTEEALYANLPETRTAISTIAGYPTDNTTSPNNEVAEVSGSGQKIGPSITLKVMAGDHFNIKVSSWYRTNGATPGTPVSSLTDLVAGLINGLSGPAGAAHGNITAAGLQNSGIITYPGARSHAAYLRQIESSSEEIARRLYGLRRQLGIKYKSLTPDNLLQKIYQRNMQKYGDKLGPSIDYLRQQGKSWDDIINSAARTGGKDLGF